MEKLCEAVRNLIIAFGQLRNAMIYVNHSNEVSMRRKWGSVLPRSPRQRP